IRNMMDRPSFNRQEALELQRNILLVKRERLDQMIETIEKTIQHMKGERNMSNQEKFKGFDFSHNPYEQEAREKWGDPAVDQANEKVSEMTAFDQEKFNAIFHKIRLGSDGVLTPTEP